MRLIRRGVWRVAHGLGWRAVHLYENLSFWAYTHWHRQKIITAMIRVRNEEEFLEQAVRSIVNHVDRVVIIDNLSDDGTPAIVRELVTGFSGKVVAHQYPHSILRVGEENEQAAAINPGSPNLLANYYNFCLSRCETNFVLKWDGDMIATDAFAAVLTQFRASRRLVLHFRGANVHPNGMSFIAGAENATTLVHHAFDNYTNSFTDSEPRIFPRFRAKYDTGYWWCEHLESPFMGESHTQRVHETAYAHLKYCKRDPYANLSPEFAAAVQARIRPGPELEPDVRAYLHRWGVAGVAAPTMRPGSLSVE